MLTLRQDIAYALRQMRLSPVFTLTAMLTLALGIGATTAIFSLIHTVMLKSLPVADPGSLYRIGEGEDCCVEGSTQDDWGFYSYDFTAACSRTLPSSPPSPPSRQADTPSASPRRIRSRRQAPSLRNGQRQLLFHLRTRRNRKRRLKSLAACVAACDGEPSLLYRNYHCRTGAAPISSPWRRTDRFQFSRSSHRSSTSNPTENGTNTENIVTVSILPSHKNFRPRSCRGTWG